MKIANDNNKLISVVVAVYNIEKYIGECIESILNQTFSDFELILVDDGSTDKSSEICDSYKAKDSRVRVIHQQNKGPSGARNTGIKVAMGKYVYFVDSDDLLHKDTLKSFVDILGNDNNYDCIMGSMSFFQDGTDNYIADSFNVNNEDIIGKTGKQFFTYVMSNIGYIRMGIRGLYNVEFLRNNELYLPKYSYSEDQEWVIRLLIKANKIAFNSNPYYLYRENRNGSLMNTLSLDKTNDTFCVYNSWIELVNAQHEDDELFYSALREETVRRYISACLSFAKRLPESDMSEFYERVKQTKKIIKNSKKIKCKLIYLFMNIFGVRLSIKMLNNILSWRKKSNDK